MASIELGQIDLNLFVTLDAVLREGSVRGAAVRLGVTQSAVSHGLRRLRDALGDPLVVRTARGMRATPRAERLANALRRSLGDLDSALRDTAVFEPAVARRTFTISAADATEAVLLPPLMRLLVQEAPNIDLIIRPQAPGVAERLADGELDIALGVFPEASGALRVQPVYRQQYVCMVRQDHPEVKRSLTLERYLKLSHIRVAPQGTADSPVDDALARQGRRRKVALVVPHFLVAPMVVAETDLALLLPERLARRYAELVPVRLVQPPLEVAGFTVSQLWSERVHLDPGHMWLRKRLASVARSI